MSDDHIVRRCDECKQLYKEKARVDLELVSFIDTTTSTRPPSYVVERTQMVVCPDCAARISIRSGSGPED